MRRPRYGKAEEIELRPDAWDRFRRGVQIVAKAKPKHRTGKPRKPRQREA
jgi:hypothetical protein